MLLGSCFLQGVHFVSIISCAHILVAFRSSQHIVAHPQTSSFFFTTVSNCSGKIEQIFFLVKKVAHLLYVVASTYDRS